MRSILTFDYELFFGNKSGTLENCILKPTEALIQLGQKYNVNFVFFVDSGYIIKLKEFKKKYKNLQKDYDILISQIEKLDSLGHSIQLHIHPHWEDSYYDGSKWIFDTSRYRLHSFNEKTIEEIVFNYKKVLTEIVGDKVFAFRAGGWSIQPFSTIKNALKKNNIWLDSTVFYGGYNKSATHFIDFRKAPFKDFWRFEDDILVENSEGFFTEIPISSLYYSPLFFWKFAYTKKFNSNEHKIFGDGIPVGASKKDIIKMLLKGAYSPVSTDGYKSKMLQKAYNHYKNKNFKYFVTIGHPKALSEFALKNLEKFVRKTYNDIICFEEI